MTVILALGIRAVTKESKATVQQAEPQEAYVLIHTMAGESWGFYGQVTIEYDRYEDPYITLDRAWIVGTDHECYNPYAD